VDNRGGARVWSPIPKLKEEKAMGQAAMPRGHLHALDGLRGIAALMVFAHHCIAAFWLPVYYTKDADPLLLLANGHFAVHIFFLMSGFVLSLAFVRNPQLPILVSSAARRYFRLAIPSIASVLFAYGLMALGFAYVQDCARVVEHNQWLAPNWNCVPTLHRALKEGLWYSCFGGEFRYNPVLWTMTFEFHGSLLLFGVLALTSGIKNRWLALLAIACFCVTYHRWPDAEFIVGGLLCMLWVERGAFLTNRVAALAVLATSLYAAWRLPMHLADWSWGAPQEREWIGAMIGAIGVVFVAVFSPLLQRALSNRFFVWLGKISFPLYLFHLPILFSAGAGTYLLLHAHGWGNNWAGLAATVMTAALSFPIAALGAATIEPWSVRIGYMAYRLLFEPAVRRAPAKDSAGRDSPTLAA
jgi:peptidoglycan/LPS O-acetylase OafA/YrhL